MGDLLQRRTTTNVPVTLKATIYGRISNCHSFHPVDELPYRWDGNQALFGNNWDSFVHIFHPGGTCIFFSFSATKTHQAYLRGAGARQPQRDHPSWRKQATQPGRKPRFIDIFTEVCYLHVKSSLLSINLWFLIYRGLHRGTWLNLRAVVGCPLHELCAPSEKSQLHVLSRIRLKAPWGARQTASVLHRK